MASHEPSEWEKASFFTKWSYQIANDLLDKGVKRPLEFDDLLHIQHCDTAAEMGALLKEKYRSSKKVWFVPRLMVALIRTNLFYIALISVQTITEGLLRISMPLILIFFLEAVENSDRDAGYLWAGVLSAVALGQTLVHHVLFFINMKMGWNWKTACTAFIYEGLFHLQGGALQSTLTGKMVNMISNDVTRIEEFAVMSCYSWEAALEVVLILLLLIYILNWPSALAGVGSTFLIIPMMAQLSKHFARYRTATAHATDQRVRHIGEIIDGIASVKAYAWEKSFFLMIHQLRDAEMKQIKGSQTLRSVNQGLMYSISPFVSFLTFLVFWLLGGTLSIPKVFATISLLQVLKTTVGRLWVRALETGSEALASCARIEAYLDTAFSSSSSPPSLSVDDPAGSRQPSASPSLPPPSSASAPILTMNRASYYYGKDPAKPVLQDISFSVHPGELVMVVGPVGCGKSTLLTAILGEMNAVPSDPSLPPSPTSYRNLAPHAKLAYCAQSPWILAGSIKANIVLARSCHPQDLSQPYQIDQDAYEQALECCRIVEDLESWPAYDETEIGERGVSISGGQRARIALARAVYAQADLYLLDDPLSAVDAHVGKALLHDCIRQTLQKQAQRAIVLVTHQLQYLRYADRILVLNPSGQQIFWGDYPDLRANRSVIELLQYEGHQGKSGVHSPRMVGKKEVQPDPHHSTAARKKGLVSHKEPSLPSGETRAERGGNGNKDRGEENGDASEEVSLEWPEEEDEEGDEEERERGKLATTSTTSTTSTPPPTTSSGAPLPVQQLPAKKTYDKSFTFPNRLSSEKQQQGKIIATEDRQVGEISWQLYLHYLSAGGAIYALANILLILFSQGILMITDYWLNWWTVGRFLPQDNALNLVVFAILTFFTVIVGFLRALFWFQHMRRCAVSMHQTCLYHVLHSPLTFFFSNPTGRILNRFTKDQNLVDEVLPQLFFLFLESFSYCIAGVLLVCISLPWFLLAVPFLLYGFMYLRKKYTSSSRAIKRLDGVTRSFLYTDFSSTLQGLYTLRAYGLKTVCLGSFFRTLDANSRTWWSFLLTSRWVGLRLDLETNAILLIATFLTVTVMQSVQTGLIGFALVYVIQLSALFQWAVRQSAEIDTQMTSVERIQTYGQLPAEAGYLEEMDEVLGMTGGSGEEGGGVYAVAERLAQSTAIAPSNIVQLLADKHVVAPERWPLVKKGEEGEEGEAGEASEERRETSSPRYYNNSWLPSISSLLSAYSSLAREESSLVGMRSLPAQKAYYIRLLSQRLTGSLRLHNLTATYRHDLPPILRNLSLTVPAGTKLGICGRTGSGKSSLLVTLMRLNYLTEGAMYLDDINLTQVDVEVARKLITIIPQEPHLFSGSLRYNLDPFGIYSDEEIYQAMSQAHIAYVLGEEENDEAGAGRSCKSSPDGHSAGLEGDTAAKDLPRPSCRPSPAWLAQALRYPVEERGTNFSVGEKQLLSLSRAILNQNKIVLMDEVTANIDYQTDQLIQQTLRSSSSLGGMTIITIAHRLRTIADYDRILVLSAGEIVEDGTPQTLLERDGSLFRSLAQESGEWEEICRLADKQS